MGAMKIGQRVMITNVEGPHTFGVYAGTAVMQRFENSDMETMAIVRLDMGDCGYIQPDGRGKKPVTFVSCVVVHPENLTVG